MNSVHLLVACLILQGCSVTGKDPKIVIVGAGPAGIAAATHLLENGMTNINILEAESRIGGRIYSPKFGGANIDMGAEWCRGENIVYEKVKDLNLLSLSEDSVNIPMYHSTRRQISKEFSKELISIMDDIQSHLGQNATNSTSAGVYCKERYINAIYRKFNNDQEKLKIAKDALEHFHLGALTAVGAFSWFDVAAVSDYQECEGNLRMNWKGKGYRMILDVLMKKYPNPSNQLPIDDKILLNKEVEKIHWNSNPSNNSVQISCSDGSTYSCDHVIFTPSIGVLKDKATELFVPSLPSKKLEAITNIGFGATMKVFMSFSEPWWNDSPGFRFIWDENDVNSLKTQYPEGPYSDGRSWITYMSIITKEDYNPNVLSAWFTGNLVPAIEVLTEDKMKDAVYFVMNKFLGHLYNVSKPDEVIHSKWYTNPHFRGTYSFQTLHSCNYIEGKCAEADLAEPLRNNEGRPVVQFAGEATHPYHYSTAHGAIETGFREAKTLVDLYKNHSK